jgi:hypothetical protein
VLDAPVIIAHARLVVIGGDTHRLHEELITAGGEIRNSKWARRLNVGEVENILSAVTNQEPSGEVKARLLELYPSLMTPLASALESRRKDRVEGLQKRLAERAEKEVGDITSILTELKRAIEAELDHPEYVQPTLFDSDEQERFERNKDAMQARVREIPAEIERETEAIRARFASPQARMFPVAVTMMVPMSLSEK